MKRASLVILIFTLPVVYLHGMQPRAFGDEWNNLPQSAKLYYALGVAEGARNAYSKTTRELLSIQQLMESEDPSSKGYKLKSTIELNMNIKDLVEGMDYLYSDPANKIISHYDILYFARDRALGVDIRESIREERKRIAEFWSKIN